MSDLTEKITEDGFSNPSMKTMIEYFRGFSHVIETNLFGFQSFLISKNPPSSELIKQINIFKKNNDSKIYSAWIRSKTEKNINQLSKVLVSKVSQIFLYENDLTKLKILIIGDNEIARSYANICQKLNLKYKKLSENEIKSNCESDFSAVIFTDSNQQKRIDKMKNNSKYIIYPFEDRDENNYVDTYLISGDQDLEYGKGIISDIEKILH
jgi:hypothetical protein